MNELTTVFLGAVFVAVMLVILPLSVYLCAKMAVLGYLKAREYYERSGRE